MHAICHGIGTDHTHQPLVLKVGTSTLRRPPPVIMERESFLRSLPYFHPSSWPTPVSPSARNHHGGAGACHIRKLIFPRHVVSIEPGSSDVNTRDATPSLGPAFFGVTKNDGSTDVNKAVLVNDKEEDGNGTHSENRSRGQGGFPAIDRDPALCPFEASVLMPRSFLAAGASPGGASSATTDIAYSRSPTTPAARKVAAAGAASSSSGLTSGLTGTSMTKHAAGIGLTDPEPVLYFRFGRDGTYCVDHGRILNIALEAGTGGCAANDTSDGRDKHGDEGQSGQSDGNVVGRDEANQRATRSSLVPPNVVISFDTCSFRIFDLEQTLPREEQLKNLRSMVNELAASLRAAGSTFVPPPTTEENSMDKVDSGDTQSSCGRASLEEGGQRGIELESSGSSEVRGRSEAKDEEDVDAGHDCDKEESSDPTTDGSARRVSEIAGASGPSNARDEAAKRRRRAYDRSAAATERVASLADPLPRPFSSTRGPGLGFGPAAAEEQISMLMTAAANALTAAYDAADDGRRSDDVPNEVDRVRARLDGTMAEFFPVHARTKHQRRGGSLSMSMSMSMASPSGQSPSAASDAALGDPSRDADDLRNDARRMMKEYREAIIARHKSAILPSR